MIKTPAPAHKSQTRATVDRISSMIQDGKSDGQILQALAQYGSPLHSLILAARIKETPDC